MMFPNSASHSTRSPGFTLVELAVVLAVIGLLVGGILAGQSMLRASQLNSVSMEYAKIISSVKNFQSKYKELPGDMSDASQFWSGAGNGNGNGRIGSFPTGGNESYAFWQHLSMAGLMDGTYTGVPGANSRNSVPGSNVLQAKLDKRAGWTPVYWDGYTDANDFTPKIQNLVHAHVLMYGTNADGYETYSPVLTPTEAWKIDTKMDDGVNTTGSIQVTVPVGNANCNTSTNSSATAYNTTYTSVACGLFFIDPFRP